MDRSANENFTFNQQTEFVPILGLIESQLNSPAAPPISDDASSIQENHHPEILALLSNELSVSPEEILDFDL